MLPFERNYKFEKQLALLIEFPLNWINNLIFVER
jgi:hypothetical protein